MPPSVRPASRPQLSWRLFGILCQAGPFEPSCVLSVGCDRRVCVGDRAIVIRNVVRRRKQAYCTCVCVSSLPRRLWFLSSLCGAGPLPRHVAKQDGPDRPEAFQREQLGRRLAQRAHCPSFVSAFCPQSIAVTFGCVGVVCVRSLGRIDYVLAHGLNRCE